MKESKNKICKFTILHSSWVYNTQKVIHLSVTTLVKSNLVNFFDNPGQLKGNPGEDREFLVIFFVIDVPWLLTFHCRK